VLLTATAQYLGAARLAKLLYRAPPRLGARASRQARPPDGARASARKGKEFRCYQRAGNAGAQAVANDTLREIDLSGGDHARAGVMNGPVCLSLDPSRERRRAAVVSTMLSAAKADRGREGDRDRDGPQGPRTAAAMGRRSVLGCGLWWAGSVPERPPDVQAREQGAGLGGTAEHRERTSRHHRTVRAIDDGVPLLGPKQTSCPKAASPGFETLSGRSVSRLGARLVS
jgi:hypothetical protein